MRRFALFFPPLILLGFSVTAAAQNWSGILSPNRAIDWSQAGVAGSIPNRTTVCATLNPGVTAGQINSAIQSCASGQVVFLNAGTYNLSSGIDFGSKSNVTLRGAGADKTFLVFSGDVNCKGFGADICVAASSNPVMPTPSSSANWTAGYAKGATSITLSSTSGISVGTTLILDQQDDASDDGTIYICANSSCTSEGGDAYGRSGRAQQQLVKVAGINGNIITITPGLYMPNWRSGQNPGASWASSTVSGSGIEDMSLDHTRSGNQAGIVFLYVSGCWLQGVRSIGPNRSHIWLYQTVRSVVRDSYFYGTQNAASQSYGIESFSTSDNLIENNIFQHVTGPITINGADSGSVNSYNFAIDDYYAASSNWMIPSIIAHESGIAMDLFEGNDGLGFEGDDIHGTHHFLTVFRNNLYGDVWNNPVKSNNTDLVHLWAFSRYFNIVGSVLGRTNFYDTYQASSPTAIFALGDSGGGSAPNDPKVATTLMRWGNYAACTGDSACNANRFVSGEVPSGLAQYANPVPANNNLPASFYLSSKPSWFGSTTWPPIGPDVVGGNGPGGHSYAIPAKTCWYNVMSGVVGSSGVLSFNANTCYSSVGGGPPPPKDLQGAVR